MSNKNKKNKKSNVSMVINEDVIQESKEYRENGGIDAKQDKTSDNNGAVVSDKKIGEDNKVNNIPAEKSAEKREDKQEKKPEGNSTASEETAIEKEADVKPVAKIKDESRMEQSSSEKTPEDKKEKRPTSISLKDKSEQFKKIIDIALAFEKVEEEKKRLKKKNTELAEENAKAEEDKKQLQIVLESTKQACEEKQGEIDKLKADVEHRNEVIDIVKADKTESSQEFKNALGASLKTFHTDFVELKGMEMSNDVGYAISDTLENVFKVLEKNGIVIK